MQCVKQLLLVVGLMLAAPHAHAVLPSDAIATVVCPGGHAYNGQTGLATNIVMRNTGGTIKILEVKIYDENGTTLKAYSSESPPPGFLMHLSGMKMAALSSQAIFGNATVGRLTTVIRYQNVTPSMISISEALVTATDIDTDRGSTVSRTTVICRGGA